MAEIETESESESESEFRHFFPNVAYFSSFDEFEAWFTAQAQLYSLNHAPAISELKKIKPITTETTG